MNTVTVKASWMKACGYPEMDTVLEVTRVQKTSAHKESGFAEMYHVIHNNRAWVVAGYRCASIDIKE